MFGYQCYFPDPVIENINEGSNFDGDDDKLTKKLDIVETLINKFKGVGLIADRDICVNVALTV